MAKEDTGMSGTEARTCAPLTAILRRTGHILFEICGDGKPIPTFYWQVIALESAAAVDADYRTALNMSVDTRRACKDDMVRVYLEELHRHGSDSLDKATCRRDYGIGATHALYVTRIAAMTSAGTGRADRVYEPMGRRAAQHVPDVKSLAVL